MATPTKTATSKSAATKSVAARSGKESSKNTSSPAGSDSPKSNPNPSPKLVPDFSSSNDPQAEPEIGQLSLDVYESSHELIILAPIAGVKLDDINLSITEDVLTISGKRKLESRISSDDYLIQECFWGEFSRSIVLPDHIDSSRISASFKDGILRISIPKIPGSHKAKLIKIQSS